MASDAVLSSDLARIVLEAMERAPGPLTLPALKKALTKPFQAQAPLAAAIVALAANKQLFPWPGTAKTAKYWVHDPESYLRQRLLETLGVDPRTTTDLAEKLNPWGPSGPKLLPLLKKLAAEGKVYLHPPIQGATPRWALCPPAPEALLQKTLKAFREERERLVKQGCPKEQLALAGQGLFGGGNGPRSGAGAKQAAAEAALNALSRRLLGIIRLAANGSIISLRDLRRLGMFQKADFDPAILELQKTGIVYLDPQTNPFGYSENERSEWVTDGQKYYVAIGLR